MIIYRKDKDKITVKVIIEIDNVPEGEEIDKVVTMALENIENELWEGTIKTHDGKEFGLY
jgi:hypothetical protein